MILDWLANRWFQLGLVTLLTFAAMYGAKYWFVSFTRKIKNVKARRGLNVLFGVGTSFVLAAIELYAFTDIFGGTFTWTFATAAALGATGLYLIIEKVFGESVANEVGKAFCEFVSRSDLFDGKLSAQGAVDVAKKLLGKVDIVDKKEAAKEKKAIDEVLKKLDGFIADGEVTEAERAEADKILENAHADVLASSTYAKYQELLKQR